MTDRELLEMAAKAAGVKGHFIERMPEDGYPGYTCGIGSASVVLWNPLTDDGDALRLAVQLKLVVYCGVDFGASASIGVEGVLRQLTWEGYGAFAHNERKQSATRRAIVRAAAEIGKGMP